MDNFHRNLFYLHSACGILKGVLAEPVRPKTTTVTTTAVPSNETSVPSSTTSISITTRASQVHPKIKPLNTYPNTYGNRAPGAPGFGLQGNGFNGDSPVHTDAYPAALKIFGVIVAGMFLGIVLCVMRQRSRRKLRLELIRGTGKEEAPSWISGPLIKTMESSRYHWMRNNLGSSLSVVSSRCLRFGFALKEDSSFEAAMCDKGHTKGKHIYAIMWPRDQKYSPHAHLSIGIGYSTLDLKKSYSGIVGGNRKSLGFCLTHNYLVFNNEIIMKIYPRNKPPDYCTPTLVYMYLDLDEGILSFGTDDEYWGVAFNFGNFKRNMKRPFHFMVGARGMVGKFMLFYKGCAPELSPPLEGVTNLALLKEEEEPPANTKPKSPVPSVSHECEVTSKKSDATKCELASSESIELNDVMLFPKESGETLKKKHIASSAIDF